MTLANRLNTAPVERVPVKKIQINRDERRRERLNVYKDLQILADSIDDIGLVHPIVVDQNMRLVAGERRLVACSEKLDWKSIPARIVQMSEEEFRAVELDENEARADFNAFEVSRDRLSGLEAIIDRKRAKLLKEKASRGEVFEDLTPGEERKVRGDAQRESGIHPSTLKRDRKQVRIVEEHPTRKDWTSRAFNVYHREQKSGDYGKKELAMIEPVLDAIPSGRNMDHTVEQVFKNFHHHTPETYRKIVAKAKDKDPEVRARAVTDALRVPPVPDSRLAPIAVMIDELRELAKGRRDDAHFHIIDARKALEEARRCLQAALKAEQAEFDAAIKERR